MGGRGGPKKPLVVVKADAGLTTLPLVARVSTDSIVSGLIWESAECAAVMAGRRGAEGAVQAGTMAA